MSGEVWKPVVGHEAAYEVSDQGGVRSVDRVQTYTRRDQYTGKQLTVQRRHAGQVLVPAPSQSGHLCVVLGRGNTVNVHTLVITAFHGPAPDGMECRHMDGVCTHNAATNLEWGTRSQNLHDAVAHGDKPIGSAVHCAKLTEVQVREIASALQSTRVASLARRYCVAESSIRQIRDGRSWRHVTGIRSASA